MVVDRQPSPRRRRTTKRRAQADPSRNGPAAPTRDDADDHVFLCGYPTLEGYLSFVKDNAIERQSDRTLAQAWSKGHKEVTRRQRTEAGIADDVPIGPIPARLKALEKRLYEDPLYDHAFDIVDTSVGMVELDRMVVYQKHIDLAHTRALVDKIGKNPTPEAVFRLCLPFDHPRPPVKWMRTHGDQFAFVSPSNDLRILNTMSLEAHHIRNYTMSGTIVGVVGLPVGFGSNFLNVVQTQGRIVLRNGSHRAYALRAAGVKHVPCVIQHVRNREELKVVQSSDLSRNPHRYLSPRRPPMLRDYFDPKLHSVIPCVRQWRHVRIKFWHDESDLPAL